MTLNEGKCHLLVCGHKHECMFANIGSTRIWEEYSAKLLGIHIDRDLSFQNHMRILCKSAGGKISMIAKIAKYLSISKRKLLIKTFFAHQMLSDFHSIDDALLISFLMIYIAF